MSAPERQLPGQAPAAKRKRSRAEVARTVGFVILAVLITLFAVLNSHEVKVDWIFGSGRAPLIIVIVISLLVGVALTHLIEALSRRQR